MSLLSGSQPNFASASIGGAGLPSLQNHDGGLAAGKMLPVGGGFSGSSSATGHSDATAAGEHGATVSYGSSGGASISTMAMAVIGVVVFLIFKGRK